ncbi:MAG: SusE domain-containing protein [Bacteroidales bacterium]|nr:SusE domain-containing protein [Bacteroidales bacterium]
MKKITYLILVVLGIGFLASCEKDFDNPVLNTDNTKAPELTLGFTNMVLDTSNASETINFSWDAVEYDIENIAEPTYRLQMKHADSSEYIGGDFHLRLIQAMKLP